MWRKARKFFPEFNIRFYDKNSESDYFFFLHQNQNIFFSNIGNQNIFLEKNHNPPPFKLNGRSLNVLRKLKYRLNRNYLEKLYLTFIRPVLEYASEVWDNCGQINSDRLEKVQLEAARIVTGLLSFASINSIYIETGWEKLKARREVRKLVLFY